jgi:diaminohydroxyphosphoribosylaminopyrimidine deaminase/5-amino-6-(5-phosphoribosylamino)uracil reductase
MSRATAPGFMRRALALAKRGKKTFPNPRVGCVLVKDGRVVGEGWHDFWGGPHAEAVALQKAGKRARGATAFVTLEPCAAHAGKKTPPCADALVKAGVKRVVAALRDPNPLVAGRGLAVLKRARVIVFTGTCAREAAALNAPVKTHVILKLALSLDGKAHAVGGASRWITGPAARNAVHDLRANVDAILVGIGTVLKDDPALTSHGAGKNPVRVVLDTRGRTPNRAKVLDGSAPTWIFTASRKNFRNATAIRVRGVEVRRVLAELGRRGVRTLLVEGGPTVAASFLAARAVDEAQVFIAPKFLSGTRDPNSAPRVVGAKLKSLGPDYLISGRIE